MAQINEKLGLEAKEVREEFTDHQTGLDSLLHGGLVGSGLEV